MEEMIGNVKLNYEYYSGKDYYSDGEIEEELLRIVKNHEEEELNGIIAEKGSWPILYHLSHVRANIIDSFAIKKNETVLEIGSGCGAITGKLAEKAEKVTCIELSKQRSLINAYRNKKHDNIEIVVGNFQDIERNLTQQFEYITLIGVFEYAESYIAKKDAYGEFLQMVMKHLKPGGQLIVAIENKLGMKYWAGCQEDHVAKYFEGIEGYPSTSGVKTFSKQEWETLLNQCGITKYTFYYPYPDYKFPEVIYSDDYLPKQGELTNNTMNLDRDRLCLFDESKVFDTMIGNKMFPVFSNSFLISIENGEAL